MQNITQDIHSLTSFRRNSAALIKQIKKSKRPIVMTVKNKVEIIVQDAESYQRLLDTAAQADVYEALRQGLEDVANRRTRPAHEIFKEMRKTYGFQR